MAERARCDECNREFKDADGLAMHNAAVHKNIVVKPERESNKLFIGFVIVFVLIVGGILAYSSLAGGSSGGPSGNVVGDKTGGSGGDSQKINIGFKGGNYYPQTITVKYGVPVEITLDNSVGGCFRTFRIPALGVSKNSASPSDTIKFTPNQKGTFRFQCGMAMGTGTIIVE